MSEEQKNDILMLVGNAIKFLNDCKNNCNKDDKITEDIYNAEFGALKGSDIEDVKDTVHLYVGEEILSLLKTKYESEEN